MSTANWHDPIVAELHALRALLSERYPNLAAYSQAAEAHCRELGFRTVRSPAERDDRNDQGLGMVSQPTRQSPVVANWKE